VQGLNANALVDSSSALREERRREGRGREVRVVLSLAERG
jgi:hypothetical protein